MELNFTPEVVLWLFLCMRTKSAQNAAKLEKIQVLYETGDRELNFTLNI